VSFGLFRQLKEVPVIKLQFIFYASAPIEF